MQTAQSTPGLRSIRHTPSNKPHRTPAAQLENRDEDFLSLLSAYRMTGGLATGAEIGARPSATGFLELARSIAERRVLSFVWRDEIWLPIFQFEAGHQTLRPEARILIDVLSAALDDWAMAGWFVEPNAWLRDAEPLALITNDFERVHDAARALRFSHCC